MKKLSKKQKIILLIGVSILVVVSLRPTLKTIEMSRVNVNNQITPEDTSIYAQALKDVEITGLKKYANYDENYSAKKGQIRLLFFQDGQFCRDQFKKQCFTKEQFRVLSTDAQDDQVILKSYFNKTKLPSTTIKFMDLNKDNVEDLLMFNGSQNHYRSINFYSAQDNHVLWQISDFIHDDFYGPLMRVKILNQSKKPATIVVYQPENSNKYTFYKSINTKYQVAKPLKDDWKNYWSGTSTWELVTRVVGFWSLLLLSLVFPTLIFIILIILVIKATSKKLSNKAKK